MSDARCVFDMGVSQQHVCSAPSPFVLLCVLDFRKDASLALEPCLVCNHVVLDFNLGQAWIRHERSRRRRRLRWSRGSVRKGEVHFKIMSTPRLES